MAISVGGLVSGLDTDSIISQLVALERRPITKLQQKEANFQVQLSAYGSLKSGLSSLNSALEALKKADDFTKFKASSADTDIFTVSTDSDAVTGSFNITVHNLAQGHKLTSSGFGETESVGTGTLIIQLGEGDGMTIDVAAGDTLQDVADAINAEKGDVSAGVIFDGTNYFLTLTGNETGESNTIKITVNDTGDANNTDTNGLSRLAYEKGTTENPTLTQTHAAMDAVIDVDGVTGIKRSSNTLDDVITGVSIELLKAHGDPATESTQLVVSRDTNSIVGAVDNFVSAYNDVIDFLNSSQSYNKESGAGGALLGDATAKLIQRRLNSMISTKFPGMDSIQMLADLGIVRDENGKLELTTATLTKKLSKDFDGVVQFFTQTTSDAEGFSVRMMDELDAMINSTEGTVTVREKGIQASIDGLEKDMERVEARTSASETRIRAQFNALELLLSEYQTTGNYLTQQISSLQNLNTAIANR